MNRSLGKLEATTIILMTILSIISGVPMINAEPQTITVPTDYPTIEEAINAANPGDTVFVLAGLYKENLTITKRLSLMGEDKDKVIIDGEEKQTPSILIDYASDVEVSDVTIKNKYYSIKILQSSDIRIHDIIYLSRSNYHIWAKDSPDISIFDCTMSEAWNGIYLLNCQDSIVENNEISNLFSGCGVIITSTNTTVRNNKIHGDHKFLYEYGRWGWDVDGISVSGYNNTVAKNTFFHLWDCIVIGLGDSKSNTNKILENKMIGDPNSVLGTGISFFGEGNANNTIVGNTFSNFSRASYGEGYAIGDLLGNGHRFYYNNFINSAGPHYHPSIEATNITWDDGAGKGNYWDDYTGEDMNGDDVGDTKLPHRGVDNYPLMSPYNNIIQRPTAFIDEIEPNPVKPGESVSFVGHGLDIDGQIIEYNWTSTTDKFLSDQKSFTTSSLSAGTHNILFKVRNDDGLWSPTASQTLIVTEEESTQIEFTVDYNENNIIKVPFETNQEATEYIENFEANGEPYKDFGNIPLDLIITNNGLADAQNVVIDLSVSVIAVLYELSAIAISSDIAKPISKTYPLGDFQSVGTVDASSSKPIHIDVPVYYASVIVGTLTVDLQTPEEDEISFDILITLVTLEVTLTVSGSNFDSAVYTTPTLRGLGDPTNMLKEINEKLAERVQEIQLREMLKQYYSTVLAVKTEPPITNIKAGETRVIDTTVDPGTKSFISTILIPTGVNLLKFSVLIGGITYGITTSAISGFAMIFVGDLNIVQTQKAFITVETASPPVNITLSITKIGSPDFALNATENFKVIEQGQTVTYPVTVKSCYGFNSSVTLSLIDMPTDMTFEFTPNKITVPRDGHVESYLKISTRTSVSPKVYNLTIVGESGSKIRTFPISLEITESSLKPLTVALTVNSTEVQSQGTVRVTVTITEGTTPIKDANVTLSAKNGIFGETFGITDENGKFETTFVAPTVTEKTTIKLFATGTKNRYRTGSEDIEITVNPKTTPTTQSIIPIEWILVVVLLIAAMMAVLLWLKRKKS